MMRPENLSKIFGPISHWNLFFKYDNGLVRILLSFFFLFFSPEYCFSKIMTHTKFKTVTSFSSGYFIAICIKLWKKREKNDQE